MGITAGSREVPGRNACDRRHTYLIIIIIIIIIITTSVHAFLTFSYSVPVRTQMSTNFVLQIPNSSLSKVTGLDNRHLIPSKDRHFSSRLQLQSGSKGPTGPLSNRKQGPFPDNAVTLTTHLQPVPKLRCMEQYIPSPIHLYGVMLIKQRDSFTFYCASKYKPGITSGRCKPIHAKYN